MNGGDDQFSRELMQMFGRLEEAMKHSAQTQSEIRSDIRELRDRQDAANRICQEFELFKQDALEYRESRRDLPQQVNELKEVAKDYLKIKPEIELQMKRFNWAWSLALALQVVVLGLFWLMNQGVIKVNI